MSQNPNPYEATSYGSGQNPPGPNNPNYPYEQFEPTQRAQPNQPGAPGNNPYGQPSYGQPPSGPSDPYGQPAYGAPPPGQASNPYGYPNPSTPPPPAAPPPGYTPGQYGGYQAPAPTPSPRRSPAGRIALIAVAALVILAGIIAAIAIPIHNTQVANDNATATAQTNAILQARKATAVAQSNATATAQAVATATAVASTYPFSANVKLNDPLSDNSKGNRWRTDSHCSFTGGSYHATNATSNTYYTCPALNTNFSDFTYQVTMQLIKGDAAGITFRGNDAATKYYTFVFGQDGSYVVFVYNGGHPTTLKSGSASFNSGQNQIGVVARSSTIALYLNKQEVATVTDSTLSGGQIGVIVYDTGNADDAAFTDAMVWGL